MAMSKAEKKKRAIERAEADLVKLRQERYWISWARVLEIDAKITRRERAIERMCLELADLADE